MKGLRHGDVQRFVGRALLILLPVLVVCVGVYVWRRRRAARDRRGRVGTVVVRYLVRGAVQGVGFRWFVMREAHRLSLRGWVTNLPDGTVEVLADGPGTMLAELQRALARGPSIADVTSVENLDVPHDVVIPNSFTVSNRCRSNVDGIRSTIRDVPNFPRAGITFKDITPLLLDAPLFRRAVELMTEPFRGVGASRVSRSNHGGSCSVRRLPLHWKRVWSRSGNRGNSPWCGTALNTPSSTASTRWKCIRTRWGRADRVIIVDNVLATGGTAAGAARLVRGRGAAVVGFTFLIELDFLKGREKLEGERVEALLHYS